MCRLPARSPRSHPKRRVVALFRKKSPLPPFEKRGNSRASLRADAAANCPQPAWAQVLSVARCGRSCPPSRRRFGATSPHSSPFSKGGRGDFRKAYRLSRTSLETFWRAPPGEGWGEGDPHAHCCTERAWADTQVRPYGVSALRASCNEWVCRATPPGWESWTPGLRSRASPASAFPSRSLGTRGWASRFS